MIDDQLGTAVHDLIIDICDVLYQRGYQIVPVGAIMRLVGVQEERARLHDNEWFELDESFVAQLEMKKVQSIKSAPADVTIH